MTIIEQIYEIVKSLPQEQANEILNFAESIQKQHLNANQSNATLNTSTSWEELVYCLSGAWGQDFPTLEEIRADMGEDILRESF
jgi:hypothetical protein